MNTDRRAGDKVLIQGGYQHNAYHHGPEPQRFWHFAKYEEARRQLKLEGGERILDVGCGSGVLSDQLADVSGTTVVGLDANESAIRFCTDTYDKPNLEFHLGLLDEFEYAPGSFDRVVFLEVIEHITQQQARQLLRAFHRVLKPGGMAVISTPNRRSLWPWIERLMDVLKLAPNMGEGQHEYLYDLRSLSELATAAGFVMGDARTINALAPWFAFLSWPLALRLHQFEVNASRRFGSILVCSFYKPETGDALARPPG